MAVKILCLGDSITAATYRQVEENYTGYVPRLAANLPTVTVVNEGYNGATTKRNWVDPETPNWLVDKIQAYAPDIVVVMLGTNDVLDPSDPSYPGYHVLIADYEIYLRGMITTAQRLGVAIILMTPPPLYPALFTGTRSITDLASRATLIRSLATEYNTRLVDNQANIPVVAANYFTVDGIHLSNNGHDIVYNELLTVVQAIIATSSIRHTNGARSGAVKKTNGQSAGTPKRKINGGWQ